MDRYPMGRSGRRKHRSKKWAYMISVLLIILAMKIFTRSSGPACVVGDVDELITFTTSTQADNDAVPAAPKPAPQLNLREIPSPLLSSIRRTCTNRPSAPGRTTNTRLGFQ